MNISTNTIRTRVLVPAQFAAILVCAIFMLGCNSASHSSVPGVSTSTPSNGGTGVQNGPAQNNPIQACYADRCLATIDKSTIGDPNYNYADPNTFSNPALRPQYRAPNRLIDLMHVGAMWPLSKNFVVDDFMNAANGRYAVFSTAVAAIFQKMRDDLQEPIIVTSGFRSPGHNSQVPGSAQWSRHMYGDAVDFSTPSPDFQLLQKECEKYNASFTLIYTTHIHCDWRTLKLDGAFYNPTTTANLLPPAPVANLLTTLDPSGNTVTFSVVIHNEDNEGDLIYAWNITNAQNSVSHFDSPTVTLPIADAPYKIDVLAGGSVHLHKTWPTP